MTIKNMAASVRQRLLDLARTRQEDFTYLLTRFALERMLHRLASSPHAEKFVLKGACLFELWTEMPHRATRDIDLLGYGDKDIPQMVATFRDICSLDVEDDGLRFLPQTVVGLRIKEDQEYEGIRLRLTARLESARILVQVDVGFGDVITPPPVKVDYPTLLPFSAPRLKAYPRETVVAEKFQAMVGLGMANSRMKDLFDLDVMARVLAFEGATRGQSHRRHLRPTADHGAGRSAGGPHRAVRRRCCQADPVEGLPRQRPASQRRSVGDHGTPGGVPDAGCERARQG